MIDMVELARQFKAILVPALALISAAIVAALVVLVLRRASLKLRAWRRTRVRARYLPALRTALSDTGGDADGVLTRIGEVPNRHRAIVADALLEPLRVVQGTTVDRARQVAAASGLLDHWRRTITRGTWASRARAAHALGLLRDRESGPALVALLDDAHPEVRAATVDALGLVGDVAAVPALLSRIGQQSRHQQARLVEALRRIGPAVTESIVGLNATAPGDRRVMADVLALVGGTGARATLLDWTSDADPGVRAAAWRAIGVTGMDDRVSYHALRAMTDPDARVRAHAAQALGRTGRSDFVPYLAQHLDDEWEVAAQGARALARLGAAGVAALRARAASGAGGHGLELARHFLWEQARA